MNVAIVDGDAAYPPSNGKRLRTLNLMIRLARRHRITYIARCHDGPAAIEKAADYLRENGIESVLVDHPLPRKKGLAFCARLAANLLSPLPYSVTSFDSPLLRRVVREHEDRRRVDVWQFEWTPFLEMVQGGCAPRVLIAHNIDSLIWRRYCETERRLMRRWFLHRQWRKFESYERRTFRLADRVVTVSDDDADLACDLYGIDKVEVVDNGVDTAFYAAAVEGRGMFSPRRSDRVLFLGSLDWRPNLDAVQLLLDGIFPAVRAQIPSARLCIVGRKPPEALRRRVAATDFAELHADVADVRPYLAEAGVMAVPLRIGGGSRLKILESLAAALPVVATRVGAEGLRLENGRDLMVVERPEDMAAALVRCILAPEEARRLAEHGRAVVREHYDWNVLADKLEALWQSVARRADGLVPVG
ncbi:MAG TPA: glycosyltransferase [Gemmataceae bacterium]|nr:glycosyltransferase [Gemmataceae bacterium]